VLSLESTKYKTHHPPRNNTMTQKLLLAVLGDPAKDISAFGIDKLLDKLSPFFIIPVGLERLVSYIEEKIKDIEIDIIFINPNTDPANPQKYETALLYKNGKILVDITYEDDDGFYVPLMAKGMLKENCKKALAAEIDFKKYDVIGLSADNATRKRTLRDFVSKIKALNPAAPLILGGPLLWGSIPKRARMKGIDAAVNLWGEIPLAYILKKLKSGALSFPLEASQLSKLKRSMPKGTCLKYVKKSGEIDVFFKEGVSQIPKSCFEPKRIPREHMYLWTMFGCPWHKCSFCSWGRNVPFQFLPVELVTERAMHQNLKILSLCDSSFLYGPRCEEYIKRNIKDYETCDERVKKFHDVVMRAKEELPIKNRIFLNFQARSNGITKKRLELLKEIGNVHVSIGFESGSDCILTMDLYKGTSSVDNVNAIDVCAEAGVTLTAYFIMLTPRTRHNDIIKTLQLMAYISKRMKGFTITGYPLIKLEKGTPLEELKEYGVVKVIDGFVYPHHPYFAGTTLLGVNPSLSQKVMIREKEVKSYIEDWLVYLKGNPHREDTTPLTEVWNETDIDRVRELVLKPL